MTADRSRKKRTVTECVISSRFLMLQSKRMMLATLERRLQLRHLDSLRARVDAMRAETRHARELYCETLLAWGTPETPDFWPVAYERLVETAADLSNELKRVSHELSSGDKYQVATDVEMLENLTEGWRASIRASMSAVG